MPTTRKNSSRWARMYTYLALKCLMDAMQFKPGPYPDPECPIGKWQEAHSHLLAARTLLDSADK